MKEILSRLENKKGQAEHIFLAAALAAYSSSQYHVVVLVVLVLVPELLSKSEFFWVP